MWLDQVGERFPALFGYDGELGRQRGFVEMPLSQAVAGSELKERAQSERISGIKAYKLDVQRATTQRPRRARQWVSWSTS